MIIDVSSYQKKIDWARVKLAHPDIEGVYIKASEGIGYTDPNMRINAVEASKNGFKVGFYHYATLNNVDVMNDARTEAKYFATITKNFTTNLPYVLDIEKNGNKTPRDKILLWIKTFFDELEHEGITDYCLYSYTPFLNDNLPVDHDLGSIPLWIAAYTETLKLPHGWDKAWLWQYTQKGAVEGIRTLVDLNKKP